MLLPFRNPGLTRLKHPGDTPEFPTMQPIRTDSQSQHEPVSKSLNDKLYKKNGLKILFFFNSTQKLRTIISNKKTWGHARAGGRGQWAALDLHSLDNVTCHTMRWLRSALVGVDCWLSVGSDKPSSSLPSSPAGGGGGGVSQSEELSVQRGRYSRWISVPTLRSSAANGPLTHSEVDVALASAHDQICFGIRGRRVRGFRRRIV